MASIAFGCQPAEEDVPSPSPRAENPIVVEAGVIASPAGLAGEYRIAGVNGKDVDLPHGISAVVDETTIRVSADCLNFAWSYRFKSSRLVTETMPVASCRRALLPPDEAVRTAIDAAETVRRTPANGIELSGGGHSVTLFSQ
jgi:hypothetical protein